MFCIHIECSWNFVLECTKQINRKTLASHVPRWQMEPLTDMRLSMCSFQDGKAKPLEQQAEIQHCGFTTVVSVFHVPCLSVLLHLAIAYHGIQIGWSVHSGLCKTFPSFRLKAQVPQTQSPYEFTSLVTSPGHQLCFSGQGSWFPITCTGDARESAELLGISQFHFMDVLYIESMIKSYVRVF